MQEGTACEESLIAGLAHCESALTMRLGLRVAAFLLLTPWVCMGQEQGAIEPFAARTIRSLSEADEALAAAARARMQQERWYDLELKKCHEKFWADPCLVSARNNHQDQLDRIRAVEVQAGDFKRQDAAREADERRAARQASETELSNQRRGEREESVRSHQAKIARKETAQRDFERGAVDREKRALEEQRRIAARIEARKKRELEDAAARNERAERARAHEAKVAEITRRAKEKEAAVAAKQSKPAELAPK